VETLGTPREIDHRLTRKGRRTGTRLARDPLREFGHDLLQPAATIAALVAAARLQPDIPEAVAGYLDQIESEARHISAACHFLLRNDLERVPVPVDDLVADAVRSTGATFEGSISIDTEPATVAADPVALRRAVLNMVSNACRAAGPDGVVVVRVRAAGEVTIEVADSGPGFGAGPSGLASLGLGIVRRIATEHGGDLRIGRGTLGGASVQLSLPRLIVLDQASAGHSARDRGGVTAKFS
jgi:signal transduction histidine kinase